MSKTRVQLAARRHSSFVLPVVGLLAAAVMAGCGKAPELDGERTATLIQPVARLEVQRVQVAAGNRTGAEIYQALCTSCHAAGLLAAPKTGEAGDWTDRIALGFDAMVASVIDGKGAMPARGGGADLTDTEVARAVAYLLNTAGGDFTEPPVE